MLKNNISSYVISSRIRLARNAASMPFPNKISDEAGQQLLKRLAEPLTQHAGGRLYVLKDMAPVEVNMLKEQHLISPTLVDNLSVSGVVLNKDKTMSVMLNEEDHIRIQVIFRGMELERAYEFADKVDDLIAEKTPIAYDGKLGYITSCPTNLGTGMRASVMMFLPALTLNNTITNVIFSSSKDALALRGVYGEGSQAEGYMYQLSNRFTLGVSEKEIINMVTSRIVRIAEAEEAARGALLEGNRIELTDMVMRAWGILTNAYKINSAEFMEYISQVKLGAALGLIKIKNFDAIDDIITECRPAVLSVKRGRDMSTVERDIMRAETLKNTLPKLM